MPASRPLLRAVAFGCAALFATAAIAAPSPPALNAVGMLACYSLDGQPAVSSDWVNEGVQSATFAVFAEAKLAAYEKAVSKKDCLKASGERIVWSPLRTAEGVSAVNANICLRAEGDGVALFRVVSLLVVGQSTEGVRAAAGAIAFVQACDASPTGEMISGRAMRVSGQPVIGARID